MSESCTACFYQPYYQSKGHFSDYFDRITAFFQVNSACKLYGVVESGIKDNWPENITIHGFEPTFKRKKRSVFNNLDALFTLHKQVSPCNFYHFLDVELLLLFFYLALSNKRYRKSTIIITQHSTNSYKGNIGKIIYRFLIQLTYRLANKTLNICFITNGKAIGDDLHRFFGIPDSNILLCEWGAEPISIEKSQKRLPNSFLLAGILRKDKGLELLSDVLPSIKEQMQLTIAGYPMDYTSDEIFEMFSSCPDHIEIRYQLTYLDESQLNELMSLNQFLLIPYKPVNKSSSGPLIQGLLHGIIPIVSNYGERARILTKYANGLLFDYNRISFKKSLHKALLMTDEAKIELERYNKNLSGIFSWNSIFNSYLNAYEKWSAAKSYKIRTDV